MFLKSTEIHAKWYYSCSRCLTASESDLVPRKALFLCASQYNLLTFLTQDQAGFGCAGRLYLCAFSPMYWCICVCVCVCERLLSASAPAGASKWIIHARFEYMQMVHSPLLAQIQVTYGNGAFKKHLFTPPPPPPPPASLRHPPSDHVIHPVVLFRLLQYQAGWLHTVGWQDIP